MKWFFSALVLIMPIIIGIEANAKLQNEWYYLHKLITFWIGISLLIFFGIYTLVQYIKKIWGENKKEIQKLSEEIAKVSDKGQDKSIQNEMNKESQTIEVVKKDIERNDEMIEEKDDVTVEKDNIKNLINSWIDNDKNRMKIDYEVLQNEETISSNKIKNEAFYYSLLYQIGDDSNHNFETIEKKAEGTEVFGDVMNIIATAYESTNNYEIAISYYEKGLAVEKNKGELGYLIRGLAHSNFMSGNKNKAYSLLKTALNSTNNNEEKFEYLKALAEQYDKDNNTESKISALEKALEIKPNDKSVIFDLAYTYGETNQLKLALLHYKNLVRIDPVHKNAINNLGVAYEKLGMRFSAVKCYKKATELDHTLAASNLALSYINAGFEGEARGILEQANSQEEVDVRVGKNLVNLQEKIKREKEEVENNLEVAQVERIFQRKLASAEFDLTAAYEPRTLNGKWILEDKHQADIEIQQNNIIINWTKSSKKFKFEGEINNRCLSLKFFEMEYEYPYLAKGERGFINKGIAIGFVEECSKMQIKLKEKDKDQLIYYKLLKVEDN
jgi:Flp pilus assembly protein TadD